MFAHGRGDTSTITGKINEFKTVIICKNNYIYFIT